MSDKPLTDRLRHVGLGSAIATEAADTIASLTLEVAQLKQALERIVAPYDRDGCMMGERYADAVWIAKAALKEPPHVR